MDVTGDLPEPDTSAVDGPALRSRLVEVEQELAVIPDLVRQLEDAHGDRDRRIAERDRARAELEAHVAELANVRAHVAALEAALHESEERVQSLETEIDRVSTEQVARAPSLAGRLRRLVSRRARG